MILPLSLFGKTLRKSWIFSMEDKNDHYSKRKKVMFETKWHFFLSFLSLLKASPPLSEFSYSLSFTFVLSLSLPPQLTRPLTMNCNPPTFHLLRLPPPHTFRSPQKACLSRYHPLMRLCFYQVVRRNIHFSVISHSLCNRTVILFEVKNGVKLHITFLVM